MQTWQIQEAKSRLSELVRRAEQEGPQDITWHGRSVAVLMSSQAYQHLAGQHRSLVDFMQASPMAELDDELSFDRESGLTRDISL
jgi:prevent-host-death family protein